MKNLPIGIQDFEKLRTGDFLYVDKTTFVHRLVNEGSYYFLSRPRRFGKSLLLSTLKAVFQGKEELFKGLFIEDKWDWETTYPVVHISFAKLDYQGKGLEKALLDLLAHQAEQHQIKLKEPTLKSRFSELISSLSQKQKAVLLIDEYDKPLIDYLDKERIPQAKANQRILKAFYSVIKDNDPYLKFVFITGVSKFSKVSIFSDLNNLQEITSHWDYVDICGYTQEELESYFKPYFPKAMQRNKCDEKTLLAELKQWYNGYSWDARIPVYNPFSILNFFSTGQFRNYWFKTGTPTFLINLLKERFIYNFNKVETSLSAIENYDLDNLDTIPLLLQTGYLTIIKIEGNFTILDYPNREVKESMMENLLAGFRHDFSTNSLPIIRNINHAFQQDNFVAIIEYLNHTFSTIPYPIFLAKKEAYYHSLIHLSFTYLGLFTQSEVNTSRGRCDTIVHTDTHIYVMEFKLNQSAKAALTQIKDRGYPDAFHQQNKKVVLVGINFNSELKAIDDWKEEVINIS